MRIMLGIAILAVTLITITATTATALSRIVPNSIRPQRSSHSEDSDREMTQGAKPLPNGKTMAVDAVRIRPVTAVHNRIGETDGR